jgi:HD-like signal output (HDOD) protein
MKPRSTLNAAEASALVEQLQRRLEGAGLATQPEVAVRILNLVSDPDSGMRDYADVIKSDAMLSGRLLRLANSAFFAQRQPVSSLERACVLLGLERLKAVSLGFYLSRSAAADTNADLSRRIWGESLFRACLMSELTRPIAPALVPEAFVVGLMLDAGVPLLVKWLGAPAAAIFDQERSPASQFRQEFRTLPFTHVDVGAAMARRWRLPEALARPIERHHAEPCSPPRPEPVHQLHRLAYCVGMLRLDVFNDGASLKMGPVAERVLGVNGVTVGDAVRRALHEHDVMRDMFRDVAAFPGDMAFIADRAHQQLVEVLDNSMISQLRHESRDEPETFSIAGHRVDVETIERGQVVAYLSDSNGCRLMSHTFDPAEQDFRMVMEALGLEIEPDDQSKELETYLRSLAA